MKRMTQEEKKSILRVFIISIIGICLSILFIWLYVKFENIFTTIVTSIFSACYITGSIVIINKKELIFENTKKVLILFPIIYILIIFAFLIFVNLKFIDENPKIILDCFLYSVYMMPSYLPLMALVVLVIAGLGYAG